MAAVVLDDDTGRFGRMLAGLIEANLAAQPTKETLLDDTSGVVVVALTDHVEDVRCELYSGVLRIAPGPTEGWDLRIEGTEDAIMGLSTVPLRFGLPDLLASTGRGLASQWLGGRLKISGLPAATGLLRRFVRLLSVTA